MQNRMVYGVAILFSLIIYLLFVVPLDFAQNHSTSTKIGLIPIIVTFPLFFAWLFLKKGPRFFLVTVPYYFVGLFFLYRGLLSEDQLTIFEYSFIESRGSLAGVEYFLLYFLISIFGVVLQLIFTKSPQDKS